MKNQIKIQDWKFSFWLMLSFVFIFLLSFGLKLTIIGDDASIIFWIAGFFGTFFCLSYFIDEYKKASTLPNEKDETKK